MHTDVLPSYHQHLLPRMIPISHNSTDPVHRCDDLCHIEHKLALELCQQRIRGVKASSKKGRHCFLSKLSKDSSYGRQDLSSSWQRSYRRVKGYFHRCNALLCLPLRCDHLSNANMYPQPSITPVEVAEFTALCRL